MRPSGRVVAVGRRTIDPPQASRTGPGAAGNSPARAAADCVRRPPLQLLEHVACSTQITLLGYLERRAYPCHHRYVWLDPRDHGCGGRWAAAGHRDLRPARAPSAPGAAPSWPVRPAAWHRLPATASPRPRPADFAAARHAHCASPSPPGPEPAGSPFRLRPCGASARPAPAASDSCSAADWPICGPAAPPGPARPADLADPVAAPGAARPADPLALLHRCWR